MSLEFYLFDVDHGQSAALRLPDGRWCLFDIGSTDSFSPTKYLKGLTGQGAGFRYYKATVSHWHGDHLADHAEFMTAAPEFIRTVSADEEFMKDLAASSAGTSFAEICTFGNQFLNNYPYTRCADYGSLVRIDELSLPVAAARAVSSSPNSAVNNASVVTRITFQGHSTLLCGDMELEGWDYALNHSPDRFAWQALVQNVQILVAPHHGHSSAYSTDLMRFANPDVVLASVKSGDEHVDTRYSQIPGIQISNGAGNDEYKMITTRQKGTIKVTLNQGQALLSPLSIVWNFDADGRKKADSDRFITSLFNPPPVFFPHYLRS